VSIQQYIVSKKQLKNWGALGHAPYSRGVDDPIDTLLPHVYYPAEFGRSRSNGTSVIKETRLKK